MLETKTLWDTTAFRFSREEAIIAPAFREWLSNSPSELGKFLVNVRYGSEFCDFTGSDVRALESMIVKASGAKTAAVAPLRLLGKIVHRVNHTLQFSIPQPALAIHLTPPNNPLVSGNSILAHRSVEAWLKAETSWLKDLRNDSSFRLSQARNVPFELLLLSAALHSGILNSDMAMALRTATMLPERYIRYTSRPYFDLSLAWQGKPDQEIRRWYPDDGVACLLTRLVDIDGESGPDRPYSERRRRFCDKTNSLLTAELRRRKVAEELLPRSLSKFFEQIALYLRSEIPAVMVGFATRQRDSRSLLPPSIDQVYGDPSAHTKRLDKVKESKEEESVDTENAEAFGGDGSKDDEPIWMELVRKNFGASTDGALQQNFDRSESESIVARRIISFTRSLRERGASSRRKLKPASLKCCVLTVGRRLGRLLEERDPAGVAPETLEDLYVRAIDDAAKDSENPPHLQATVAWAMREFHCFLISEKLAKSLNEADVFRVPCGILTVDAHMVTVDDVVRAFDYLHYEPNPWSDENREIAKMQTLLGFFGGVRTLEGLLASRRHLIDRALLPFLVLPTDERGLKTPNAPRTIPLATFMEPFNFLAEYAAKWARSASERGGQERHDRLFENASDDVIIPMIGQALRAVTKNERLRYYSLRHSFGSWTLLRLLLSDLPEIPDLFPHLPLTTVWVQNSKRFRWALCGGNRVDNDHSWCVSTLLGHATPSTSFASYCHTVDILLAEYLRNVSGIERVLSTRDRLRLSSRFGRSAGYERLPGKEPDENDVSRPNSEGSDDPDQVVPKDDLEQIGGPVEIVAVQTPDEARLEEQAFALEHLTDRFPKLRAERVNLAPVRPRPWLEKFSGLLEMCAKPDHDFRGVAKYFGFEQEQVRQLLARCDQFSRLKSAFTGEDLHTTVTVNLLVDAQSDVTTIRIPRVPDPRAMAIAKQLADKLAEYADSHCVIAGALLNLWTHNVLPDSGSIVFKISSDNGESLPDPSTKELIKRYCRFLLALEVKQRDLDFFGCCGTNALNPPTSWYGKWGLYSRETCKIRNLHGPRAARFAGGEWLAIGPARACPAVIRDVGYRDAFRFAMLAASICFGDLFAKGQVQQRA